MLTRSFAVWACVALCCGCSTDRQIREAGLAGRWQSATVRSDLHEWKNATQCRIIIQELEEQERREFIEQFPFTNGVFEVTVLLSTGNEFFRAPDSGPGWINEDGELCLGPFGSSLKFEVSVNQDVLRLSGIDHNTRVVLDRVR